MNLKKYEQKHIKSKYHGKQKNLFMIICSTDKGLVHIAHEHKTEPQTEHIDFALIRLKTNGHNPVRAYGGVSGKYTSFTKELNKQNLMPEEYISKLDKEIVKAKFLTK